MKTGDWNKALRTMKNLRSVIERIRRDALQALGEKGMEIVIGHLMAQDLNWEPLSDEYKQQKAARGDSTDMLIASRSYVDSIATGGDDSSVWIGVPEGARNEAGEELALIAAVHEYGSMSRNIPDRPLWSPALQELLDWWEKDGLPAEKIIEELKKM